MGPLPHRSSWGPRQRPHGPRKLPRAALVLAAGLLWAWTPPAAATCVGGRCRVVFVGEDCAPQRDTVDEVPRAGVRPWFLFECQPLECSGGGVRGRPLPTAVNLDQAVVLTPRPGVGFPRCPAPSADDIGEVKQYYAEHRVPVRPVPTGRRCEGRDVFRFSGPLSEGLVRFTDFDHLEEFFVAGTPAGDAAEVLRAHTYVDCVPLAPPAVAPWTQSASRRPPGAGPPPVASRLPEPSQPPPATGWDAGGRAGRRVEVAAGASLLSLSGSVDSTRVAAGGLLRGEIFGRGAYRGSSPWDRLDSATQLVYLFVFPAIPLLLVPDGVWLGNERGLRLETRLGWVGTKAGEGADVTSHVRVEIGLAPVLRVARGEGRWSFPSVIGVLVPETGVVLTRGEDVRPYVRFLRLEFGRLLGARTALRFGVAGHLDLATAWRRLAVGASFELAVAAR